MFKFLEKLQNSDEGVKQRWMIISTIVIMAAVIYFWLGYFNNIIAGFNQQPAAELPSEGGGFGFWSSFKSGAAAPYDGFGDRLRAFGEILKAPREYIVEPPK